DGSVLQSFYAFPVFFAGGVRVAAGDVNGDGAADIVTGAGAGGGPLVAVYNGATQALLQAYYALPPTFRGGVYVAAGVLYSDGLADVVVGAGAGAGPLVDIFNAAGRLVAQFYAYPTSFRGGVRVGTRDIVGNGRAEILTTPGKGSQPVTLAFDSQTLALLAN